jgi:(3,5-dihydroxyphenyl)acetyl-CoA 1,2-dioxygenase
VELRNPRHLNAEDDTTLGSTEAAVDLVLLDPEIEVGVLRGGVVDHPRYAGRRIFGAGINLTRLYRGMVAYLFYVVRDLGYVHKIFRGLSGPEHRAGPLEETTEKLWIAAAETYAIGGACQLLHVVDHVIAERGCRLYLPARKEGIIPGASNLRLPRSVGDRIARQAILSGREFEAGTPDGDLLCDEVVEAGEMDAALTRRVELLTSSGLVNAAANRRALRVGQEPLDVFRAYMATYAREQAFCHFSPALVGNLERNWNAHERRL